MCTSVQLQLSSWTLFYPHNKVVGGWPHFPAGWGEWPTEQTEGTGGLKVKVERSWTPTCAAKWCGGNCKVCQWVAVSVELLVYLRWVVYLLGLYRGTSWIVFTSPTQSSRDLSYGRPDSNSYVHSLFQIYIHTHRHYNLIYPATNPLLPRKHHDRQCLAQGFSYHWKPVGPVIAACRKVQLLGEGS